MFDVGCHRDGSDYGGVVMKSRGSDGGGAMDVVVDTMDAMLDTNGLLELMDLMVVIAVMELLWRR
ncbi:unnamed protein product [Arabidopsis halleri]